MISLTIWIDTQYEYLELCDIKHKRKKFEKTKPNKDVIIKTSWNCIVLQIGQEILSKAIKIALYVLYCTASVLLFPWCTEEFFH